MRRRSTHFRILTVSLALAGLLLTSAGLPGLGHDHDNVAGRVCQTCQVAHMPLLAATGGVELPQATTVLAWHLPADEVIPSLEPVWNHGPSRAPPAFSL